MALESMCTAFLKKFIPDFVEDRRMTLTDIAERSMKKGKAAEQVTGKMTTISVPDPAKKLSIESLDKSCKIHISPATFIDFLDCFHPPLFVYCIYELVFFSFFPKIPRDKSIHLIKVTFFQKIRWAQKDMPNHYLRFEFLKLH